MESEHRSIILAMLRRRRATAKEGSGVSGARYSLFLSFAKGMQALTDALESKLRQKIASSEQSVALRLNTRVSSISCRRAESTATRWHVAMQDGAALDADALCLAVPSHVASKLLSEIKPSVAARLCQIRYASTATLNLGYTRKQIKHPLDGFGFVVPFVEKRSLIACTFSSVKFAERAPENCVLLRAFVGGDLQPEMFELSDREMIDRVKLDLVDLLQIEGEPLFAEVSKWRASMPQYEVGHLDLIDAIDTELTGLSGLALAGNAYRGAGIPDCIRSGELAARKLMDS